MDMADELLGETEKKDKDEAKKRSLSPMADILDDMNEKMPPVAEILGSTCGGEIIDGIINIQQVKPDSEK